MRTRPPRTASNQERGTPQPLFDALDREFGFNLDPAASHENAKCNRYYTEEEDGLRQSWASVNGAPVAVFLNPPYNNLPAWLRKSIVESAQGATVVCLLPNDSSTEWFHQYIPLAREVRFVKGRLTFEGDTSPAPFASMVVVYDGKCHPGGPRWVYWDWRPEETKKARRVKRQTEVLV